MPSALTTEQNANVKRELRKLVADGMKQKELSEILGVEQPSVSRMLSPVGGVKLQTAQRLARYLGIELEPMLRGERVMRTTVRALDGYDAARADLSARAYPDAVLDAATRALDAVHANEISVEIFEAAAHFAQRFWPRTKPEGKAAEIISAMKAEKAPSAPKRRKAERQ